MRGDLAFIKRCGQSYGYKIIIMAIRQSFHRYVIDYEVLKSVGVAESY